MTAEKEDQLKLPWIHRLILKLPKINLPTSGDLQGIYWTIVIPVFFTCEFFLSLFLLIAFPFPINLVVTGIIPVAVFVVFVKVQLERFMNWWNLNFRSEPMEWNVEKASDEYIKLLQKQRSRNKTSKD